MSGVTICAWCGSADTQQGLDKVFCLACGQSTDTHGERTVADSFAEEGKGVADMTEPEQVDNTEPEPEPEPEAPADTPDE